MRPSTSLKYITLVLSIFTIKLSHAQELEKKDPPPFKRNRAEENYEYLNERNVYKSVVGDKFKLLSIADNIFVNIGGQYRPRLEHFTNENWTEEDATFYSQRLSLFTSLNFGQTIRLYGEMIHGYTSNEDQVVESDEIDIHQGFIEINLLLTDSARLSFRLGRQEINLGSSRLISIREGPNIKRSFDVVQAIYSVGITQIRTFYGKEVSPRFGAFDNEFNLFDSESLNPEVWTVDVRFPIRKIIGTNELYYIGFKSKMSRFADAIGREVRHTLGIRRYGMLWNRMSYNTEIAYQFGEIENKTIRAINIELDNKYHFEHWRWKPQLGLKVDVSTGDRTTGDGRINT
ncbi:MAG: alginate export family protein, partial [Bacteroidota bacterium]